MKKALLFLFVSIFIKDVYCQSAQSNFNKYWFYRDRLKKRFMVEGPNQGESLVSPRIEKLYPNKSNEQYLYHYGDQTIQMGWYLGVLATEYRLLANHSQPTANTERELYHAMKAFERLDLNAEIQPMYTDPIDGIAATSACKCDTFDFNINKTGADPLPAASINGYFMRSDMHAASFASVSNKIKNNVYCSKPDVNIPFTYNSDYEANNSTPQNSPSKDVSCIGLLNQMSQDQAYRILMGLALIHTQVSTSANYNGYNFAWEARGLATNIIKWIKNSHGIANPKYNNIHENHETHLFGSCHPWSIVSPVTKIRIYRGEQAALYSTPLADMYYLFTGATLHNAYSLANYALWNGSQVSQGFLNSLVSTALTPAGMIGAAAMAGVTALPLFSILKSDNEVFLNICAALSSNFKIGYMVPNTQKELDIRTSITGMEFYALLHAYLYNKNTLIAQAEFRSQLDDAPFCGPFCSFHQSVPDIYGNLVESLHWATKNRFDYFKWERNGLNTGGPFDDPTDKTGEFAGLDYMLYFNLYNLYYPNYDAGSDSTAAQAHITFYNKMDYESNSNFPFAIPITGTTIGNNTNPVEMEAFNSITYSGTVVPGGHVTYHAGNVVHLNSGTHFTSNATAHVYVSPFCPSGNSYIRTSNNNSTTNGYNGMVGNDQFQSVNALMENKTYTYNPVTENNEMPSFGHNMAIEKQANLA